MKKNKWIFLCLLIMAVNSCLENTQGDAQAGIPSSKLTSTHKESVVRVTDEFTTPTISPKQDNFDTPTSTIIEDAMLDGTPTGKPTTIPICKGKGEILTAPDGFGIDGTIIYFPLDRLEGIYTIGGTPIKKSKIVDQTETNSVFGFSPDGHWLIYSPVPRDVLANSDFNWEVVELILLSDTKEQIHYKVDIRKFVEELPSEAISDGFVSGFTGWINNQLMYINLLARTSYKLENTGFFVFRPKVLDPFSGEWENGMVNNLPEKGITNFSFSADLTRVLYYVPPGKLVLWDLENNKELWIKDDVFSPFSIMEWAPDNSMAVIVNKSRTVSDDSRISIVNRDGKVHWIEVKAKYPSTDFSPLYVAWSPNSRYIAMSNDDSQIYIYDANKGSFLYMCPIPYSRNLTWSPDSKYIAMGDQKAPLNLLNIETEQVIELLTYGSPLGWSATFPVDWP